MRLYVDDLRKCPEGWELARTNTEAIRLLSTGYVEEISIDHDICVPNVEFISEGVKKRLQIGQETFQPVVYYIIAMQPEFRPKKVTMHTANTDAGQKLVQMMQRQGIDAVYHSAGYVIDELPENEDL
jgi:hypothetical protein